MKQPAKSITRPIAKRKTRPVLRVLGFIAGGLLGFFAVSMILTNNTRGLTHNGSVIVIDRPAAEVFPLLANCEGRLRWVETAVACTPLTDGPVRAGSRLREVSGDGGRRVEMTTEVTSMDPPRDLQLRVTGTLFSMDVRYSLSEQAGKTFLAESREARFRFPLSLMSESIEKKAQDKVRAGLVRLKAVAEGR